jgi:hypothetical protein
MAAVFNVAVGIATAGRREQLTLTLEQLARQRHLPEKLFVCPAAPIDFDSAVVEQLPFPVEVVSAARGLCAQRNAILRACSGADLLFLFDDDFYPARDYIERALELFAAEPSIVIATHHPELDGATSSGVSHEEALRALSSFDETSVSEPSTSETYAGYGCNMVVRLAPVRAHQLWFDENLPLYSWLEDVDFSRQLSPHGRIVVYSALRGVHLGTKRGRTSGVRLGYSQIANPVYMLKKGSLSHRVALGQIARNVAKNTLRAFWPEPWVDRVGRVRGNAIAVAHLVTGQLHPLKAAKLP